MLHNIIMIPNPCPNISTHPEWNAEVTDLSDTHSSDIVDATYVFCEGENHQVRIHTPHGPRYGSNLATLAILCFSTQHITIYEDAVVVRKEPGTTFCGWSMDKLIDEQFKSENPVCLFKIDEESFCIHLVARVFRVGIWEDYTYRTICLYKAAKFDTDVWATFDDYTTDYFENEEEDDNWATTEAWSMSTHDDELPQLVADQWADEVNELLSGGPSDIPNNVPVENLEYSDEEDDSIVPQSWR